MLYFLGRCILTFMLSSVDFPVERLSMWLQALHEVLTIYLMTEVIQAFLAAFIFVATTGNYIWFDVFRVFGSYFYFE